MKYSIVTFGCRVNQADSLQLEEQLRARGAEPSSTAEADVVIVNTCSVTATADQGARQTIRRIARENPSARIVAAGCYATRRPEDLAALPNVVRVVCNDAKLTFLADPCTSELKVGPTTADRFGEGDGACGASDRPGLVRPYRVHAPRADRMRGTLCVLHHSHDARARPEPAARDGAE